MFFCIKIFRKCPLLLPIGTSALPLLAYTLAKPREIQIHCISLSQLNYHALSISKLPLTNF